MGIRVEFIDEVLKHNAEANLNGATVGCFFEGLARHSVPTPDPPLRDRCEEKPRCHKKEEWQMSSSLPNGEAHGLIVASGARAQHHNADPMI